MDSIIIHLPNVIQLDRNEDLLFFINNEKHIYNFILYLDTHINNYLNTHINKAPYNDYNNIAIVKIDLRVDNNYGYYTLPTIYVMLDYSYVYVKFEDGKIVKDKSKHDYNTFAKAKADLKEYIISIAKEWIDFYVNVYNNFYTTIKQIAYNCNCNNNSNNKPLFNNIKLNSIGYINKNNNFIDIYANNYPNKLFKIINSKYKNAKVKDFNRLIFNFVINFNLQDIKHYDFVFDEDIDNILIQKLNTLSQSYLNRMAKDIFKDMIKNEYSNFINIEDTNIRNIDMTFSIEKEDDNFDYIVKVDVAYKNELDFNYLQLDKIIELFAKLSSRLYALPLAEII